MLRGLLLVLLLANLVFFVWSQGGFGTTGSGVAGGENEPERLARQVRPETVQLLTTPAAASSPAPQASAASVAASATEAASAPSATASEAASGAASSPAAVDAIASAATPASAASTALTTPATSAASAAAAGSAVIAAAVLVPAPPAPPGTRCLEAGPFSGAELASAETALAANAKTRRIARRWVPIPPDAASAPTPTSPQHRLRIDATPSEVAVLESLPVSVVGRSFVPCTAR